VSTAPGKCTELVVIGAGVVGGAVALVLTRRGASVTLLESESEPGLGASGTNSGILHTGFDSQPGELETELILASARLRDRVVERLGVPILRCGAVMLTRDRRGREAVEALVVGARRNGVPVLQRDDGGLEIPGEAVTDPVAYTLGLVREAQRQGAELRTGFRVAAIERQPGGMTVRGEDGQALRCGVVVNCAGLEADLVARLAGDDSFSIYPRKGEFLVFDSPGERPLERILLPVPTQRTKGVLVFPTLDGKVVAGPTAVDLADKRDWSVRPDAREEIMPRAIAMYPPLADAEPIAAYAGLRPAGRDANYVIGPSQTCERLINVAAIRSTGLTASLGIGQHVASIAAELGVALGAERELIGGGLASADGPWWRRTARYRSVAV
jgi:glycerol-3-phosphate dehydrogenase